MRNLDENEKCRTNVFICIILSEQHCIEKEMQFEEHRKVKIIESKQFKNEQLLYKVRSKNNVGYISSWDMSHHVDIDIMIGIK